MLDFRYLPAFLAVAETKNFTMASRRLHIAVSAVSRQIQLLEEACGVQLVFRSPQETRLSPAGQKLFEELSHFQTQADRIIDQNTVGELKLGVLQGVLRHWLTKHLSNEPFFAPLNLQIKVANPAELVESVVTGELDATFFSYANLTQIPASLNVYRLFREHICLISKKKLALDELADQTWILFTPQSWLVQFHKRPPQRHIVVNDMSVIVDLVRKGMGIAMVPSYVLAERSGLHVLEVPKFSKEHICLVTRRYTREPQILTSFLGVLQKHCPDWKQIS